MNAVIIDDVANIRNIQRVFQAEDGKWLLPSSEQLASTTVQERALAGNRMGIYGMPTVELIEHLKSIIAGRSCIEIGAGSGILSEYLGIHATDNRQMERPEIRLHYQLTGQPLTVYGDKVEGIDAHDAIRRYRPQVVVASWVTHKYREDRAWAGGNATGVDEDWVLDHCEEYIFIGNDYVHMHKSIWDREHEKYSTPFLFSRTSRGTGDFIARFKGRMASV